METLPYQIFPRNISEQHLVRNYDCGNLLGRDVQQVSKFPIRKYKLRYVMAIPEFVSIL